MIKLPAARLEPAAGVLRRLRAALEAGVQALARTCARSGRLDTDALDAQQVASFELAWAASSSAAETGLAAA